MKKGYLYILLLTSLLFTLSCEKSAREIEELPEVTLFFTPLRQSRVVEVDLPPGNWSGYSPTDHLWCTFTLSPQEQKLIVTVGQNETVEERNSYILLQSGHTSLKINITQDMDRFIALETTNITLRGRAGDKVMAISTNVPEPFTVTVPTEYSNWLSASIDGTTLTITSQQNPSESDNREATMEISGISPLTGEPMILPINIIQRPYGGADYYFELPDFTQSNVYNIEANGVKIAQVCKEFLNHSSIMGQAIVVYPYGNDGVVDHTAGFIAQMLFNINSGGDQLPTGDIHGGRIAFSSATNKVVEYIEGGSATPFSTVYIPGDDQIGGEEVTGATLADVIPDIIEDIRGSEENYYPVVKIATQYWMGSNLNTTKYNSTLNFADIPTDIANGDWNTMFTSGNFAPAVAAYGYPNANSPAAVDNRNTLGLLYTFLAISGAESIGDATFNQEGSMEDNLSPDGWIVPTREELMALYNYIGGTSAYTKRIRLFLDSSGNPMNISEKKDENITGFGARNSSYRNSNGTYVALGSPTSAFFWTRSMSVGASATADRGWALNLVGMYEQTYMRAFSIRSIKK
ncbi:MAG: FISUMP domain-containing protein [Bacteroidales bacterium]